MSTIGFVGVGTMGGPMAANLAEGFDLLVTDENAEHAASVAAEIGARAVSRAELSAASIVVMMLPNSAIVDAVFRGDGGDALIDVLAPGSLVIDMSSSDPSHTRRNAAVAAERGLDYVDAPVSGGPQGARAGTLSIMVGATDEQFARAEPVLTRLGAKITRVGEVGAGHAIKAINNLVAATNMLAAAEALAAGRAFGLDPAVLMDVILSSSGASLAGSTLRDHVESERFAAGFSMTLMAKDTSIARSIIATTGLDLPLVSQSADRWAAAAAADGRRDMTEIAREVDPALRPDR